MNFFSELSKKLNGKYDYLKVLKVVYDATFSLCTVNFIYPENVDTLSVFQKDEITKAVFDILKIKGKLQCKFNKSYLDENIIIPKILEYLKTNFESASTYINKSNIKYSRTLLCVEIEIFVNQPIKDYFKENDISEKIKKFLCQNFCGDFVVRETLDNSIEFDDEILIKRAMDAENSFVEQTAIKRYSVKEPSVLFGGEIMPKPEFIKNLTNEKFSVILAGNVESLEEKEFLPRKNKLKGIDEKRKMYKFKLNDGNGVVNCVHFCSKVSQKRFSIIQDGTYILCLGDYKKQYNGMMQYMVKSISLCYKDNAQKEIIEEIPTIEEHNEYKFAFPKKHIRLIQNNLFEHKKEYPEYIKNNIFVVFDVETTGLVPDKNELTEIGAVKIVNGEIVETFQTLCKPTHNIISEEITKLTGISNEMVENEHSPEEIIKDFLLFSKGAIMVGYNVNFDYQFIQYTAMRVNCSFNNEFKDCMGDAKAKLFLPNYKLGTVVDHLGITLNNAHRALFDAMATAEAFLKLSLI